MKKGLLLLIIFALMFCSCATQQKNISVTPTSQTEAKFQETKQIILDNSLDSRLGNLTNQIVESLSQESKSKIAVIEFSDLNGNITEFGMYLSEELITRLFLTRKFDVIERQLLYKVLSEQKLGLTGYIDEESAISIGKLLGVDAIVSGTITDLGTSLKVNARIIATETGSVFAVAAVKINKDDTVKKLINQVKVGKVIKKEETEKPEKKSVEKKTTLQERIFFKEDFSEVDEGDIPDNWLGAEKLMVESDGRKKYLTFFEKSEFYNTNIHNVNFPENWKLEFFAELGYWNEITGNIGNLFYIIQPWCSSVTLDNTSKKLSRFKGSTTFIIIKKGNKFTLSLNGQEVILIKKPDFQKSNIIQFGIRWGDRDKFKIYRIIGTDLGE